MMLSTRENADDFREVVQLFAFKRAHYTTLVRLHREKELMALNNWYKLESFMYETGVDMECAMMHLYLSTSSHEFAMGIIGAMHL